MTALTARERLLWSMRTACATIVSRPVQRRLSAPDVQHRLMSAGLPVTEPGVALSRVGASGPWVAGCQPARDSSCAPHTSRTSRFYLIYLDLFCQVVSGQGSCCPERARCVRYKPQEMPGPLPCNVDSALLHDLRDSECSV